MLQQQKLKFNHTKFMKGYFLISLCFFILDINSQNLILNSKLEIDTNSLTTKSFIDTVLKFKNVPNNELIPNDIVWFGCCDLLYGDAEMYSINDKYYVNLRARINKNNNFKTVSFVELDLCDTLIKGKKYKFTFDLNPLVLSCQFKGNLHIAFLKNKENIEKEVVLKNIKYNVIDSIYHYEIEYTAVGNEKIVSVFFDYLFNTKGVKNGMYKLTGYNLDSKNIDEVYFSFENPNLNCLDSLIYCTKIEEKLINYTFYTSNSNINNKISLKLNEIDSFEVRNSSLNPKKILIILNIKKRTNEIEDKINQLKEKFRNNGINIEIEEIENFNLESQEDYFEIVYQ
jgi:hypothetical protein